MNALEERKNDLTNTLTGFEMDDGTCMGSALEVDGTSPSSTYFCFFKHKQERESVYLNEQMTIPDPFTVSFPEQN